MKQRIFPKKDIIHKLSTDNLIIKDIYSQSSLSSLLNDYPYIPVTNSSVDYHSLQIMINDIVINNRKNIVEFGSGISTILIARLIKINQLNAMIYSIDDNEDWLTLIDQMLRKENLSSFVKLIHAPLERMDSLEKINKYALPWYSTKILNTNLQNVKIDMVFIDGPMAYSSDIQYSRYPALFYLQGKLEEKCSVFLHDCNRIAEQDIINEWSKALNQSPMKFTHTLSGFLLGHSYTITVL